MTIIVTIDKEEAEEEEEERLDREWTNLYHYFYPFFASGDDAAENSNHNLRIFSTLEWYYTKEYRNNVGRMKEWRSRDVIEHMIEKEIQNKHKGLFRF